MGQDEKVWEKGLAGLKVIIYQFLVLAILLTLFTYVTLSSSDYVTSSGFEDYSKKRDDNVGPINAAQKVILLMMGLFAIILAAPIIVCAREIFSPQDDEPLKIDMDYVRDPFFAVKSFTKILMGQIDPDSPGEQNITLNKNEIVEVSEGSKSFNAGSVQDKIIYVRGDLESDVGVAFLKEVVSTGSARLGRDNLVRCLSCEGDIVLEEGVEIVRWISSKGNMKVADNCVLGNRVTSQGELKIGLGCLFHALYASKITTTAVGQSSNRSTGHAATLSKSAYDAAKSRKIPDSDFKTSRKHKRMIVLDSGSRIEKGNNYKKGVIVEDGCHIDGSITSNGKIILKKNAVVRGDIHARQGFEAGRDCQVFGNIHSLGPVLSDSGLTMGNPGNGNSLIVRGDVNLGDGCTFNGTIKVDGQIQTGDDLNVDGNIFCEDNLIIGKRCTVRGSLFTQEHIEIGTGTVIGYNGGVVSMVAKKGIELERDVSIHGLILTEGPGRVR
ncbi:MAG: hypothetical protein GY847_39865 [Proteobacteria bacterium]|nr:hypothetical protein [Pseudomonadota bacterium]